MRMWDWPCGGGVGIGLMSAKPDDAEYSPGRCRVNTAVNPGNADFCPHATFGPCESSLVAPLSNVAGSKGFAMRWALLFPISLALGLAVITTPIPARAQDDASFNST